jgi:outer membrane biosynthesis protein TonB
VIVSRRKLLLGVLLLTGLIAMALTVSLQPSTPPPVVPRIRVVASPTAEPEPSGATPDAIGTAAKPRAGSAGTGANSQATTPRAAGEGVTPEPRVRSGPNPRLLTRTFRGQQSKIEACFTSHARGTGLQPEVQVEFDLEASGRIKRVRVLPATFATTELGRCIERVARATKFSKQGQSVSFAIPVRASRTRPL